MYDTCMMSSIISYLIISLRIKICNQSLPLLTVYIFSEMFEKLSDFAYIYWHKKATKNMSCEYPSAFAKNIFHTKYRNSIGKCNKLNSFRKSWVIFICLPYSFERLVTWRYIFIRFLWYLKSKITINVNFLLMYQSMQQSTH